MEVLVTTRETIKPSRPTPSHHRHVLLSFLDQLNPRVFSSFFYFYSSSQSNSATATRRCEMLKKSLAETLIVYYPLAGRLKDDLFIDCNDEGVHYFQAQANCQLSELIQQQPPNYKELNKLLPYPDMDDAADMLLAIQVNVFHCGGIAIGLCFGRKFLDGFSVFNFVNSWAASTRGGPPNNMVSPKFEIAMLFPPRDMSGRGKFTITSREKKAIHATKVFVFSSSSVSALKARYSEAHEHLHPPPSRVEAVSAFIWSRFIIATQGDKAGEVGKSYRVVQAVNLRPRANPPLSGSYFGNLSRFAMTVPSMEGTAEDGYGLVTQMRNAIKKVDGNYVKKLQEGNLNELTKADRKGVSFTFSSVSKYSIYEANFGWGRPMWVTMAAQPIGNYVLLMPNATDDGIQAVINMKEHELAKLQADKEFLAFVSPTLDNKVLFKSSL